MKAAALLALLVLNGASADTTHFHFERPIVGASQSSSQTCAVLGPEIFAHAAPGLADVRLFNGTTETPYAIHTAALAHTAPSTLTPLNLGTRDGKTSFDLAMPPGTYSDLELNLSAQNFIASVTVFGSQSQVKRDETRLGTFTIFDLSSQKLGRSTVLHLPPSDLRYLHLSVAGPIKPEEIESASIARDPVAQTLYVPVADSSAVNQQGRSSVIEFDVPAHVPVDRVLFVVADKPAAFTRDVTVTIKPARASAATDASEPPQPISFSGNLLRLHRVQDGQHIDEERLAVDTFDQISAEPARWTISIANGDDAPLDVRSVRLEMQQRELCFDPTAGASYSLFYGDSSLHRPEYDYATLFTPQKDPARAAAGAEEANPAYQPRPDDRPFTERHPVLLWIALVLTLLVLGAIALQSFSSTKNAN